MTEPTTETGRLHDEILTLRADLAKARDLLRSENQRANDAIDREETAEQAALEAEQERDWLRAVVARIRQMTDAWEQRLPETIRTPAVVSALRAALDRTPAVPLPPSVPSAPDAIASAVLAVVEAAGGDTLTRDAREEALAGIAAVLPATTRHDTDTGVTGDRRARYEAAMVSARRDSSGGAVLAMDRMVDAAMAVAAEERENDRLTLEHDRRYIARLDHEYDSLRAEVEAHRLSLSQALGLGTGAPWDAIHERVAELRRVADETAATETQREARP